jgi:small subunit ribosomal protein S8
VAAILSQEKFVGTSVASEDNGRKMIKITLKYQGSEAAMTNVVRISKPGRRVYMPIGDIKPILGGRGIQIVSTSKGLMTDKQAKKANMGGEVLCKIW